MIYVALFRGINVGGKNKVDMKKLATTFEMLGFKNVVTYINSGNVVFEEPSKEIAIMAAEIEKAIKQDFQLEIKVLIRDLENFDNLCRKIPAGWLKNDKMRTDVMFLWEEYDTPDVIKLLPINPVDKVLYIPGAIVWNLEGENYNQSGIMKLIGTKLYKNITIRNVNTVRKLHEIMTNQNKLS